MNGDYTTDLVETSTATKSDSLGLGEGGIRPVTFRPDGRIMAATNSGDDEIEIATFPLGVKGFSNEDVLHERRVVGRRRDVSSLAYSPDGRTLASGSADGSVTLWDPASPDTISDPRLAKIEAIAFDSSGKTLALGGKARAGSESTYALSFLDLARRRTILHQPCARYAAPRPRTSIWAVSGDGCGLAVIDLARRKGHRLVRLVRPRPEYRRRLRSEGARFSPDGQLLAERVAPYRPDGGGFETIFDKSYSYGT